MKPLILLFTIIIASPCNAQWQYVGFGNLDGSSPGGNIFALATHDSSLFWSCPGQIYRYTIANGYGHCLDSGIDFTRGNITTFASVGFCLFGGSGPTSVGNGYLTTNDGSTWTDPIGGPVGTNGTYIFAQYATRIARSRDNGITWEHLSTPAGNMYAGNGAFVFAMNSNGIYRSSDSGENWTAIVIPAGLSISAFAVIGTQMFAGGTGVFRSTDSGSHWTQLGLSTRTVYALASYGTYLFAGNDTGILVSSDFGMNWQDVSDGMGKHPQYYYKEVKMLAILDTFLFAEVYSGTDATGNLYGYVAERPISEVTNPPSAVQQTPLAATTLAVYPNPLTNTATISYTLAEASRVNITIYDALGKTVSVPVPGYEETTGEHEITYDARSLPSGTYWCHLTAGTVERVAELVIEK